MVWHGLQGLERMVGVRRGSVWIIGLGVVESGTVWKGKDDMLRLGEVVYGSVRYGF